MSMMGAEDSGFGDLHTLDMIRVALQGKSGSVISSMDQRILESTAALQDYDAMMESGLLQTLQGDISSKTTVHDTVSFLLDAHDDGLAKEAVSILKSIIHDSALKHYTAHDLGSILLNVAKNDVPPEWMIAVFGKEIKEQTTNTLNPHNWTQGAEQNSSGLNIQAMRDFK